MKIRPDWLGILGWVLLVGALPVSWFAVPEAVNGLTLLVWASALIGAGLIFRREVVRAWKR